MWSIDRYLENKDIVPYNCVEYIPIGDKDLYRYKPHAFDIMSNIRCNYNAYYGYTYGLDSVKIFEEIDINKLTLPLFAMQYDNYAIFIKVPKDSTDEIRLSFDKYYLPDHIIPKLLSDKVCNDVGLIFYEGTLCHYIRQQ